MTSALRLKKGSTIVCLWQLAVSTVPLANYCLTLAQSSHLCRIKVLTERPRWRLEILTELKIVSR